MPNHATPIRRPVLVTQTSDDARSSTPVEPAPPATTTERELLLAFAPLHKRALGVGTGTATALLVALLTTITLLHPPGDRFPLHLLGAYFAGYDVSWPGVAIGAAWGFVVGFVAGWFFAFCRNLAVAISIFVIRTRAELAQTRDFLDHI